MNSWLLRGLVMAFLMTAIRVIQGPLINTYEQSTVLISASMVLVYAIVALVWGFVDGRSDANAQPDPDRRADLAMTWLIAGLVAGAVSGAVCWLISKFYTTIYVGGLINELTVFAAFTALLAFIMAMIGVAVGRMLVDRKHRNDPVRTHRGGEESTDTDVFEAVKDDRTQPAR